MSISSISSRDFGVAATNGALAASIDYAFPQSLGESGKRAPKDAIKVGLSVAGASLMTDASGLVGFITENGLGLGSLGFSDYKPQVIAALDGSFFAGIEAIRSPTHRKPRKAIMNMLLGAGISYVGTNIVYPKVAGAPGSEPSGGTGMRFVNNARGTTSPGFSS